jgi:hypothetical protein
MNQPILFALTYRAFLLVPVVQPGIESQGSREQNIGVDQDRIFLFIPAFGSSNRWKCMSVTNPTQLPSWPGNPLEYHRLLKAKSLAKQSMPKCPQYVTRWLSLGSHFPETCGSISTKQPAKQIQTKEGGRFCQRRSEESGFTSSRRKTRTFRRDQGFTFPVASIYRWWDYILAVINLRVLWSFVCVSIIKIMSPVASQNDLHLYSYSIQHQDAYFMIFRAFPLDLLITWFWILHKALRHHFSMLINDFLCWF